MSRTREPQSFSEYLKDAVIVNPDLTEQSFAEKIKVLKAEPKSEETLVKLFENNTSRYFPAEQLVTDLINAYKEKRLNETEWFNTAAKHAANELFTRQEKIKEDLFKLLNQENFIGLYVGNDEETTKWWLFNAYIKSQLIKQCQARLPGVIGKEKTDAFIDQINHQLSLIPEEVKKYRNKSFLDYVNGLETTIETDGILPEIDNSGIENDDIRLNKKLMDRFEFLFLLNPIPGYFDTVFKDGKAQSVLENPHWIEMGLEFTIDPNHKQFTLVLDINRGVFIDDISYHNQGTGVIESKLKMKYGDKFALLNNRYTQDIIAAPYLALLARTAGTDSIFDKPKYRANLVVSDDKIILKAVYYDFQLKSLEEEEKIVGDVPGYIILEAELDLRLAEEKGFVMKTLAASNETLANLLTGEKTIEDINALMESAQAQEKQNSAKKLAVMANYAGIDFNFHEEITETVPSSVIESALPINTHKHESQLDSVKPVTTPPISSRKEESSTIIPQKQKNKNDVFTEDLATLAPTKAKPSFFQRNKTLIIGGIVLAVVLACVIATAFLFPPFGALIGTYVGGTAIAAIKAVGIGGIIALDADALIGVGLLVITGAAAIIYGAVCGITAAVRSKIESIPEGKSPKFTGSTANVLGRSGSGQKKKGDVQLSQEVDKNAEPALGKNSKPAETEILPSKRKSIEETQSEPTTTPRKGKQ